MSTHFWDFQSGFCVFAYVVMIPARGPQTKFSENVLYGIVVLEHRLNVIRQDCNLYTRSMGVARLVLFLQTHYSLICSKIHVTTI